MARQARVDVWREPDGYWRWAYVEAGDGTEELTLLGNKEYPDAAEAVRAAQHAYPDVDAHRVRYPQRRSRQRVSVLRVAIILLLIVLAIRRRLR